MMEKLIVNGYQVIRFPDEEEPRIPSAEIAKRIGIGELFLKKRIRRYLAKGELRNTRMELVEKAPDPSKKDQGGRPEVEYYHSEHDCLYVVVKSETPMANKITHEVIDVFINTRKGSIGVHPAFLANQAAEILQGLLKDITSGKDISELKARPSVHINLPTDHALPMLLKRGNVRRRHPKILKFPDALELVLKMLRSGSTYIEATAAIKNAWPDRPECHISQSSVHRFWQAARAGELKESGIDARI